MAGSRLRTRLPILLALAFLCLLVTGPVLAESAGSLSMRQLILMQDSDLAGRDFRILKEVDLEVCKSTCLAEPACLAFTFNAKARWCFLKDRFDAPRTFVGAISGRVVEGDGSVRAKRLAELAFLPSETLTSAAKLVEGLSALATRDVAEIGQAVKEAAALRGQGDGERAVALSAAAVQLAPEDGGVWEGLAESALAAKPQDWQVRERRKTQATAAAVNAYLAARDEAERARSLALLGRTLAAREQWRPAILALRASLTLREDAALRAQYVEWRERHGFRVANHRIDADSASPRICLEFSHPLDRTRRNLADFVRVEEGGGLAVEAEERQICIDGVSHGATYRVQVREGLPAADGEVLERTVDLELRVGDRTPAARFQGRAYVLPKGGEAAIPVISVNADRLDLVLYRIGDRSIAQVLGEGGFLKQLETYQAERIRDQQGEELWRGTLEFQGELNRELTTAVPVAELAPQLKPGVYALTAEPVRTLTPSGEQTCDEGCGRPPATQWFVVSDLGLTALQGNDGLHALVRSLGSAAPLGGTRVRLIARNNEVLGEGVTNEAGYLRLEPGLLRGSGGNAPALVTAEAPDGDYGFLDLTRSPFDLSDRGVDGRPAPKPLDVFLVTDRGIYRPGETVHLTALVRDGRAEARPGIPLTLVVKRPDGVERERVLSQDSGLGGHQTDLTLSASAMRGTWRVQAYADPKGDPLAQAAFLVEDFEPERIAFALTTEAKGIDPADPPAIPIEARFLYGAPAAGLRVEGETVVRPAAGLADHPGYRFGLADDVPEPQTQPIAESGTDAEGRAEVRVELPELVPTSRLLEAQVQVRIAEPGGRPVERDLTLPVLDRQSRIGIRSLFEGEAEEGGSAGFEVIALGTDGARRPAPALAWTLEQVRTDFQWYRGEDGTFDYEPVERARRVASGTLDLGAEGPGRIEVPVEWGGYRLRIEGDGLLPASLGFEAGWYVAPRAADTPDQLKLSLDRPRYRIGERARVHIEPRAAAQDTPGIALLMVIDDRLIAMQAVEVPAGGTTVELPVTADWGPGAYVTAALYRPMDLKAKRMPGRALGLAWAGVDPEGRRLAVTLSTPEKPRPRGPLAVSLQVPNLAPGEEAYATLAAVDLGILNVTDYRPPDPETWYFGQRRLGMEIRDLYGQLIDRMQGVPGVVRSGGDGGLGRFKAPPPTEEPMTWFSGVVHLNAEGRAELQVPVPDFNGTVRLMAMAWTAQGVGHGVSDTQVRDPVVIVAGLPRFLAPGDRSRLLLSLTQVEGQGGSTRVAVSTAKDLVGLDADGAPAPELVLDLLPNERRDLAIGLEARAVGDETLTVKVQTAEGQLLTKPLILGVRDNAPALMTSTPYTLAPGAAALVLTPDLLSGLVPGTGRVLVSISRAGRLDLAGILRALDRYPHGCTEQLVSRALPLLYLDQVALAAGLAGDPEVPPRIRDALGGVLGNQSPDGSFGLWGPGGDDLWLDAYATDFLTRTREQGHAVPDSALDAALTRLRSASAYTAPGPADAYALYVLARNGRVSIGDLRYIADERLDSLETPLAKAQIGAALALYGDRARAETVLAAAVAALPDEDPGGWRADYGSSLRDAAAVLALAAETGVKSVDLRVLADRAQELASSRTYRSTQDNAWLLLAAQALTKGGADLRLSVDGIQHEGALFARFDGERLAAAPVSIRNLADSALDAMVAVVGVPQVAPPAGGNGYSIERAYYDLEGRRISLDGVPQGQRLLAVVTVRSDAKRQARLILDDPLPAGFEIANPSLLKSADIAQVPGLDLLDAAAHREFRTDRFVAAVERGAEDGETFQLGYLLRAVSPGSFVQPPASVEDMYDPARRAWTDAGHASVLGAVR
jgi:alpha-2-macroglobulin